MSTARTDSGTTQISSNAIALLPSNILYLLNKNGLTQAELARKIGISHQTLSKYIAKESIPPLKKLIDMAEILGVSADALLYHELPAEYADLSYKDDIASDLLRPTIIPECALRRYRNREWYMYYYTICDGDPLLCEAFIKTENDIRMHFIKASITTESNKHSVKIVIDYPRFVYLYGINEQNPTRFFIMFPDPDYTINSSDLNGSLAICASVIPESRNGLPGIQFVAISSNKLDLSIHKEKIFEFLTVPDRRRMLRLHPEQNEQYVKWLQELFSS
ncbi:MAG: helix-turn-helix domain-containing protein [Faecousia sp.]